MGGGVRECTVQWGFPNKAIALYLAGEIVWHRQNIKLFYTLNQVAAPYDEAVNIRCSITAFSGTPTVQCTSSCGQGRGERRMVSQMTYGLQQAENNQT